MLADPASAQSLESIFGAPGPRYPRPTRLAPPRVPPEAPDPAPLPVPRPRFPSDETPQGPTLTGPAQAPAPSSTATRPSPPEPKPEPKPAAPTSPAAESKPAPPAAPALPAAPPPGASSAPATPTAATPAEPPIPPPKPPELTQQKPAVAPSGATTAVSPRQPAEDPSCAGHLKAHLVTADPTTIGKQPDERCVVSDPVQLVELKTADGATVAFPEKPTLACITADAFSAFVRDLLVPLAKGTYGSPVSTVWTGPGLECRSRDHIFGAKLSAHGQGLAVDIAQMKLADGRVIAVGEPKSDLDQDFETAARAAGCGYFHTALGPGTDPYHATHWHFDLEPRGSGGDSKYCK